VPAVSATSEPELSVVMVCHGAWTLTERALAALSEHTERNFELILVDNASDDETPARLAELSGAQVIVNDDNRGFGPATNQGAARARAPYLLLLNTDAFVHRGWLDPLLETLAHKEVGAVVPRLLHPDGSLQDAGTLLARDGTVRVYGDGDDPERRCYRFRRVVDLASAACMLVERATFAALDGFDELFAPAYYEDADFCLRLAQRGLKVVYEPRSTVTHVRYGSGGSGNAAELSERNRRRFIDRWGPRLAGRPATFVGATDQAVMLARDAPAMPRVLICAGAAAISAPRLGDVLLDGWPSARVTWAPGGPIADLSPNPWLEIVDTDDPAWLSQRLFQYDLIVLDGDPDARLTELLGRTQPQAHRIGLEDLDGATPHALSAALARAGIAAPQAAT
jgi:GT2 family glycosyltransferase